MASWEGLCLLVHLSDVFLFTLLKNILLFFFIIYLFIKKAFDWESGPLQICNLDVLVFPFPFVEGEEEQEGTWNLPKEERLGRLRFVFCSHFGCVSKI